MAALSKPAAALALIMAAAALLVAALSAALQERISAHQAAYRTAQMRALLDGVTHDTALPPPPITLTVTRAGARLNTLHPVYHGDALVMLLLQADAPDGYNGEIKLLLGLRAGGGRAGIRVLQHAETAGIADFLTAQRADDAPDGVSGATLSAAAVRDAVLSVQQWAAECINWSAGRRENTLIRRACTAPETAGE